MGETYLVFNFWTFKLLLGYILCQMHKTMTQYKIFTLFV